MSSNDNDPIPPGASPDDLLVELESIKGLLDDDDLDIDIPILDDVVAKEENAPLLDINTIFGDEEGDEDSEEVLNLDNLDTSVAIPNFKLITTTTDDTATINTAPTINTAATVETQDSERIATPCSTPSNVEVTAATPTLDTHHDGEPVADHDTTEHAATQSPTQTNVNIDLLIQEIVNQFIPVIEDELKQRLSTYSPEVLQQLADKQLKS